MQNNSLLTMSGVALATLALFGCQAVQDKAAPDTLVVTFTSTAPDLMVGASDPL
jgi:hypothetical protein